MSDSRMNFPESPSAFWDLGSNIGTPRWFLQLGVLLGLIGGTVWLGATNFERGTPEPTKTAMQDPVATPAGEPPAAPEVARFSEEDFIVIDGSQRRAPVEIAAAPIEKTVTVGRGDTLGSIMKNAGVEGIEAHQAIEALAESYNPRRLQVGQTIDLTFSPDESRFEGLRIAADVDRSVVVDRAADGSFTVQEETIPLELAKVRAGNVIDDSLFLAAARVDIPAAVIVEMIRMYSYEVDFQRDLRSGDRFEVYYEEYANDSGDVVKHGDIAFASLTVSGKKLDLYRFTTADGETDYFHEDGKSAKRFLMKTPVDGARISSNFGPRRHPVLGYSRMHKGTDFAVPTGTPIMAAGDGVIERASRWGSFGNYVRIRHNGSYKTAYAHLSRYAKGIRSGVRVRQGQTIGYVGMTGTATGPHLHYEVLVDGEQVNAQKLDLPTGRELAGADLERFRETLPQLQAEIAATPLTTQLAVNKP